MSEIKTKENRLRRKADRYGWHLSKSRRRDPDALDYGMYAILDNQTGATVHATGWFTHCLTLDDVEAKLIDDEC